MNTCTKAFEQLAAQVGGIKCDGNPFVCITKTGDMIAVPIDGSHIETIPLRGGAARRTYDAMFPLGFTPDGTSLRQIREWSRADKEMIGNRFFEISRDRTGKIVAQSIDMRTKEQFQ